MPEAEIGCRRKKDFKSGFKIKFCRPIKLVCPILLIEVDSRGPVARIDVSDKMMKN